MEENVGSTLHKKEKFTLIYSSINCNPSLAVLVTKDEKIVVRDLKKMLLKSFGLEKLATYRIPLAKISEDKHYSLLGDSETVNGVKTTRKFIYAFELSDSIHTYVCKLCKKSCDCQLKKHVGYNCFFVLCDICNTINYKHQTKPVICPVCFKNVTALSFIKIGDSLSAISILNIPIVLSYLTDKTTNNLFTELNEFRTFKLSLETNDDNLQQKNEYTIHFINKEDHECIDCYHEKIFLHHSINETFKEKNINPNCNDLKIAEVASSVKPFIEETKLNLQHELSQEQNNNLTNNLLFKNGFEEPKFENVIKQFQQHRENAVQIFRQESQKIISEGLQKLIEQFEKISETFEKIRPPRNLDPFVKLKFSGRNDFKHPIRFVEDFEYFATSEKLSNYEKQYFFGQSLTEDAANWLKVIGYGKTYEDMRESFRKFFWSNEDQIRFKTFLKYGKYNKNSGLSMFVYFHKHSYEAKFLDQIPEEKLLTEWLCQHFDIIVQDKLNENHVKNISEALQILKSLEISDMMNGNSQSEIPYNFFSSSTSKKKKKNYWVDFIGLKYESFMKDGELFHRCVTEKIIPLHSLSYNNYQTDIKHFDVYCDEESSRLLSNVPSRLHYIYVDINSTPVDYDVLGPITIAKQNGNKLIVTTCPSFKSNKNLISGQLLYIKNDDYFKPCSIITCSIPEDSYYRYVIPNNNEQIVCLSCGEEIEEVEFRESRSIAVENLIVRYFEQSFKKKRHILRFLNEAFCTVYTVWDDAVYEYNPLKPTYH